MIFGGKEMRLTVYGKKKKVLETKYTLKYHLFNSQVKCNLFQTVK